MHATSDIFFLVIAHPLRPKRNLPNRTDWKSPDCAAFGVVLLIAHQPPNRPPATARTGASSRWPSTDLPPPTTSLLRALRRRQGMLGQARPSHHQPARQ